MVSFARSAQVVAGSFRRSLDALGGYAGRGGPHFSLSRTPRPVGRRSTAPAVVRGATFGSLLEPRVSLTDRQTVRSAGVGPPPLVGRTAGHKLGGDRDDGLRVRLLTLFPAVGGRVLVRVM